MRTTMRASSPSHNDDRASAELNKFASARKVVTHLQWLVWSARASRNYVYFGGASKSTADSLLVRPPSMTSNDARAITASASLSLPYQ